MRKLSLVLLLFALVASAADVYNFGLTPLGGSIQGAPGTTVGWGYSLQNQSTSLWLVPTNVNAGNFTDATPSLLFDFPILAPATSVSKAFDATTSTGLFQLIWDSSAPAGLTNTGDFKLDAEWWSGDPLAGGVLVAAAPSVSVPYSATVSAATVPEPATIWVTGLLLAAMVLTHCGTHSWQQRLMRGRPTECNVSPSHRYSEV